MIEERAQRKSRREKAVKRIARIISSFLWSVLQPHIRFDSNPAHSRGGRRKESAGLSLSGKAGASHARRCASENDREGDSLPGFVRLLLDTYSRCCLPQAYYHSFGAMLLSVYGSLHKAICNCTDLHHARCIRSTSSAE